MGPSQGSTLTPTTSATAAAADVDIRLVDVLPVYVKELIAGGAAGAFSKTAVAPLERIKILLQTRTEEFKSLGILRSMKKLKQHEGVFGFYKGNGASVLRIVPYAALHFMTYEQYRCLILNNFSSLGTGPFIDLLAGSAAGGTAVLCTYPLDLARTKLAYQVIYQFIYDAPITCKMFLDCPTLTGILPYAGLKFYIYEELKSRVPEDYKNSVALRLCCGALAGLFGQTLTYPLDVVRRQMQVQSQQQLNQISAPRITSTMQGISTIIHEQGWRQLFAGLSINYLKVIPSVAIGFTAYDLMKSILGVPPRPRENTGGASTSASSA
ncbi:hypothetical protein KFK09_014148 [Dendrobium nobile]|uniref:Uncharacterized protein n=1 Tax=Dendrobium nobile TaxID=94219 RepID=A0A8T3BC57_DENNO|nr:hypothetical protein KFK09_014148 [Dendrobium nobile]